MPSRRRRPRCSSCERFRSWRSAESSHEAFARRAPRPAPLVTIAHVREPSQSHSKNGATMTRSNQEDLEERIFARLDPGGELGTMLSAFRALTGNALGRGLLALLTDGAVDLATAAAIDHQIQALGRGIARS